MRSSTFSPHAYQDRAKAFILDNPKCALWLDMGLGKTPVTLSALVELFDSARVRRCLVVSTVRVVQDVWRQEAAKWTHTKHLKFSLVHGNEGARFDALYAKADVYLTNYESIPWLCKVGAFKRFDMVVFDESSKMKHHTSQRFKLLKEHCGAFERCVELTGTPASSGYLGLWSQFYLLDQGERLSEYITHYKDRWFQPVGRSFFKWRIRDGAAKKIRRRISDITLSMQASDYLKMPKLIERNVWLDLPKKARVLYEELEEEMATEINNEEVTAFMAPAAMNKCRQFTSGAVYVDKGNKAWEECNRVKLDTLSDIVEDSQGTPVLVVYEYQHELDRLKKRFPGIQWIGKGGRANIQDWNAGKIPILAAHPASAGHGLNLQQGGHILVALTLPWSLENWLQIVRRLYRQGQRFPVMVHRLLIRDSVDAAVLRTLRGNNRDQSALLRALRAHVAR